MPPTKERKADTTKNGNDLSGYIERQRKYEERLYPLRINQTTVIYVTKERYRRERLKIK